MILLHKWRHVLAAALWLCALCSATAAPQVLRVVTYNIKADTDGVTTPRQGLYTVLEAIGQQNFNGVKQPLDILALQETTSNNTTVSPIVTALNNYYGSSIYALVAFQATQNGGNSSGNGPNAMVYNATTLQIVLQNGAQAKGVPGTPNNDGVNRQVVRYQFQPVGGTVEDRLYVYVSHMKSSASGDEDENQAKRNYEAQLIRQDAATLPSTANILYVGDFNMGSSTEAAYLTMTASGLGQGVDPAVWTTPTPRSLMTWSPSNLSYRDDLHFMTTNVAGNSPTAGVHYIAGSFHVFGNNGTTPLHGSVNSQSNTALNNLEGPITKSEAFSALTTASDHLPAVADYTVLTPFEAWQKQYFTPSELANPAISGETADRERDGNPNALEYAFFLNPNAPDAAGLPKPGKTTVGTTNYLNITYTRPKTASDLTYVVEVSSDLASWFSGTTYTNTVSTTNNPDGVSQTVVVRDQTPMTSLTSRSMRVKVTGP